MWKNAYVNTKRKQLHHNFTINNTIFDPKDPSAPKSETGWRLQSGTINMRSRHQRRERALNLWAGYCGLFMLIRSVVCNWRLSTNSPELWPLEAFNFVGGMSRRIMHPRPSSFDVASVKADCGTSPVVFGCGSNRKSFWDSIRENNLDTVCMNRSK